MSENSLTHLLLDAISTVFQTHPQPERLRATWEAKIEWYEQKLQIPGEKPDPQVAQSVQLAKALLGEIPDHSS
jgi:hypothetical protein